MDNEKHLLLSSKVIDKTFVKSDEIYLEKINIKKYLHYVLGEFVKTRKATRPKSKQTKTMLTQTTKGRVQPKSSLYWIKYQW